jgi:secondary thiamine-phosphate synthase enzyme
MIKLQVKTQSRHELVDITAMIAAELDQHPVKQGFCMVFIPHTTAAVTINENADPDVKRDLLTGLKAIAANHDFRHSEGNSDAHLKASLMGFSELVPIDNHRLLLGTWQAIYLAEFDGPRTRSVLLQFINNINDGV